MNTCRTCGQPLNVNRSIREGVCNQCRRQALLDADPDFGRNSKGRPFYDSRLANMPITTPPLKRGRGTFDKRQGGRVSDDAW